jgi:hypothetical protein
MGHRAGYSVGSVSRGLQSAISDEPAQPSDFAGFSYFFGDPKNERTTLGDKPADARRILEALYSLLPIGKWEDNDKIPSGYTYLLQFVAHDLVETTVPFWAAAEAGVPSRNMRSQRLALDTLYGGGPVACPVAFEPAGPTVDARTRLRLGQVSDVTTLGITTPACPFRDLGRLKQPDSKWTSNQDYSSQVYVADERSDDNVLVAQIVVLFSILHNAIADKLQRLGPQASFSHASAAVQSMYHQIIRDDLMEKLLHKTVYDSVRKRLIADSDDWLWTGKGIPMEFAHGAFRMGHAMVRPVYQANSQQKFDVSQVLGGPVVGDPVRDPLPSNWIVEWQRFFDFANGVKPNYSLKLAVHQQLPLNFLGQFQPVAPNSPQRLLMRDWLSAANARMIKLDALIAEVKRRKDYADLAPLGTDEVSKWLADLVQNSLGTAKAKQTVKDAIPQLITDLPLPLYILLEADQKAAGAKLGPLGSVIVGETIFRCLSEAGHQLQPAAKAASKALDKDWDKIAAVDSMPKLVELAQDWGNLKHFNAIPFIAP